MTETIETIRAALDDVDRRIVEALASRHELVCRAAKAKDRNAAPPRDRDREAEILARVEAQAREVGLDAAFVAGLFREIIDHSLRRQKDLVGDEAGTRPSVPARIGYQGSAGAYSHLAAQRHFARGHDPDCRGFRTLRGMLEAVERRDVDYGILPIENTTAGSINEAYDLLARTSLAVVGEEIFRVEHCVVALEAIPMVRVRRVASHPQALAQCSEFLATLEECEIESYADTAMAVAKVVREEDPGQVAIASQEAARRHGLQIIKRGIANQQENYTRFLIVAPDPVACEPGTACKTSMIFATLHERGALARCLNVLAEHDLNLTKLESRPRRDMPWEYLFYVDVEGNLADAGTREALEQLGSCTSYLKVLGSYPGHGDARGGR